MMMMPSQYEELKHPYVEWWESPNMTGDIVEPGNDSDYGGKVVGETICPGNMKQILADHKNMPLVLDALKAALGVIEFVITRNPSGKITLLKECLRRIELRGHLSWFRSSRYWIYPLPRLLKSWRPKYYGIKWSMEIAW